VTSVPSDLFDRFREHGQEHVFTGWDQLAEGEQRAFVEQLESLDLEELQSLYQRKDEEQSALPPRERLNPIAVESGESIARETIAKGEDSLRQGEVAVLLVAGGQGSRLGFEKPKGMYPVGPVSGASLFQLHAEKVLAMSRRYGKPLPFLVMTSPATDAETVAFFKECDYFGLDAEQVKFFQQGTMPALDLATGKLLLENPGSLFLSPNGHGGTLTALADSGLLAEMRACGIRHVFYFQVDNSLVNIADPAFLGRHIETEAEASSKVVFKERAEEKVGVLALIDGKCGIVEYSDMPAEMTNEKLPNGDLAFRAGNPAIHLFSVEFLVKVTSGAGRLAFHIARKKVPFYDSETGAAVEPTTENALKFEMFVFDALPMATRWLAVSVRREDEFAPLKNAAGSDSPETVRRLQLDKSIRWLRAAGRNMPDDAEVEISPLFALDAVEVAKKLPQDWQYSEPTTLR